MPCEENLAVTRNAEVFNQVVLVLADWVFFDFGALFSLRIISSHFLPVTIGLLHEKKTPQWCKRSFFEYLQKISRCQFF